MVDLGDGFFQQIDGSLHVFALPAVVIVALFGLFQFLQRRQVHRTQAAHGLLRLADGLLQSIQIIALPRFLRQSRLVCGSSLQIVVETPCVQQSLLLLQQQLLRRRLQFGQPCGQGLLLGVTFLPLRLNLRQMPLPDGKLLLQAACIVVPSFPLFALQFVQAHVVFVQQCQLGLPFLPFGQLLGAFGTLLLQMRQTLLLLVVRQFHHAILPVGFQKGKLRLLHRLLLRLLRVCALRRLLLQGGAAFFQCGNVVRQAAALRRPLADVLFDARAFSFDLLHAQLPLVGLGQVFVQPVVQRLQALRVLAVLCLRGVVLLR